MEFLQKIEPVDYAGYIKIQKEGSGYGDPDLLDEADYPFAEKFAEELCRRWNEFGALVENEAKLSAKLYDYGNADWVEQSAKDRATTLYPEVKDYERHLAFYNGYIEGSHEVEKLKIKMFAQEIQIKKYKALLTQVTDKLNNIIKITNQP